MWYKIIFPSNSILLFILIFLLMNQKIQTLKKIWLLEVISIMWMCALSYVLLTAPTANAQLNTSATLTISGWVVTIGSTGGLNFGTFTVSSSDQTIEKQFTGSLEAFFIDDLKGSNNGYYTTIQTTALSGTNGIIGTGNISIKTPSALVSLITGNANANVILSGGAAWTSYRNFWTPLTFISRGAWANAGVIGKYGVRPFIQVIIPAYQAVGTYTATITYTLFDL